MARLQLHSSHSDSTNSRKIDPCLPDNSRHQDRSSKRSISTFAALVSLVHFAGKVWGLVECLKGLKRPDHFVDLGDGPTRKQEEILRLLADLAHTLPIPCPFDVVSGASRASSTLWPACGTGA